MGDVPSREEKFTPTEDEVAAMRGIDSAVALGEIATMAPLASERLVEHGYVGKDETGRPVLTVKGKRLLRLSSYQG